MITQAEVNDLQEVIARITPKKAEANAQSLKDMELEDCPRLEKVVMLLQSALDHLQYGD